MNAPVRISPSVIAPIETHYKGYRFRSRLEARWAVFFDAVGVRFEYEQQGFKLNDGTFYLPDFYLPDQDSYVEIKPAINYKSRNIYMAGKFSTEWRDVIQPRCCNRVYQGDYLPGFHKYVGPYHSGDNGEGSGHATIIAECTHGMKTYGKDFDDDEEHCRYPGVYLPETEFEPRDVFLNCLSEIESCDTLFAWIDSLDCYGTLAEIGYAKALGKDIFIGIDEKLSIPKAQFNDTYKPHNINQSHDLWFVEMMAKKSCRASAPDIAFNHLLANLPEPFKKIRQIGDGFLIAGNPHPGEYRIYHRWYEGTATAWFNNNGNLEFGVGGECNEAKSALLKARSARFEHGERP